MGWIFYFIFLLLVVGLLLLLLSLPYCRSACRKRFAGNGGSNGGLLPSVTFCYFGSCFLVSCALGGGADWQRDARRRAQKSWSAYFSRFHAVPTPKTPNDDPFSCAENIFRLVCLPPIVRREAKKRQVCSVFAASHTLLAVALLLLPSSTFLLTRVPTHLFVFVSARVCAWEWTSCTETHREGTGRRYSPILSVNSIFSTIIVSNILHVVYWNCKEDGLGRLRVLQLQAR